MSDDELRAAYARATAAPRDPARASCPRPEAMLAAIRREGAERARLETLDHAMACAACRAEFELLRAIEVGRRGEAGERVRRIRFHRPLVVALAASLLAAVVLVPGRRWWSDPAADVARGESGAVAMLAPADGDTVAAGAALPFAWRPVPGAGRYVVELLTPEGDVRASATTSDTTARLDAAALPPGDYRWIVRATTASGERRSAVRRLVLRRARGAGA